MILYILYYYITCYFTLLYYPWYHHKMYHFFSGASRTILEGGTRTQPLTSRQPIWIISLHLHIYGIYIYTCVYIYIYIINYIYMWNICIYIYVYIYVYIYICIYIYVYIYVNFARWIIVSSSTRDPVAATRNNGHLAKKKVFTLDTTGCMYVWITVCIYIYIYTQLQPINVYIYMIVGAVNIYTPWLYWSTAPFVVKDKSNVPLWKITTAADPSLLRSG